MPDHPIFSTLEQLNIAYERLNHPPVYTNDQARELAPGGKGSPAKNLFLRDRKGKRHFLVIFDERKELNLAELAKQMNTSRLSFASPERLMNHLGIEPGAVSPLALINDTDHAVELWCDEDILEEEYIQCHPLINTATLILSVADLKRFLDHTGHQLKVIQI